MKHIFFIDPILKLNPKKDSSLMLASTMKQAGIPVYLLFEKDFYLSNKMSPEFKVYDFSSSFYEDGCYLKSFELKEASLLPVGKEDILHMRIDPPFDTRYLRYLWMLRFYQEKGIRVVNSPDGILKYNEKLHAYAQPSSLATYVGSSASEFLNFCGLMKKESHQELILKPLDLFQGIGVEKISLDRSDLLEKFESKVKENNGPVVAQPFCKEVVNGEIRSLYFKGMELGSILKIPKKGEFLANIAQGADFHAIELSKNVKDECDRICAELLRDGVDWVAFDIMGEHVSEINITCPGLLVEVSYAHKKNLAYDLIRLL
ncbi:MAG: ATP-grasp domain-containing protein [Bacteriovorax sp.]